MEMRVARQFQLLELKGISEMMVMRSIMRICSIQTLVCIEEFQITARWLSASVGECLQLAHLELYLRPL